MLKKIVFLLLVAMVACTIAIAEDGEAWRSAPTITKAYEISSGKLYIEWEGCAPVYQVYMDGQSVANVIVNNAVIDVKKGTHTIHVYPINEAKPVDTKIDFSLDAKGIASSFGIDLAALGLDAKNLTAGTPSSALYVDYTPNPVLTAVPDGLTATIDHQDRVVLSFTDRHYSDEYIVSVKIGKDATYARFVLMSEDAANLVEKNGSTVTLVLDQEFLVAQECMVPELGLKYTFTVQLRKYARNLVDGSSVPTVVHESKDSKGFQYTPVAAWKTAPVISYASQTADGQITLQWKHDDGGLGCEYTVSKVKKTFGIRSGVENVAVIADREIVIGDLLNGSYTYVIIPCYSGEEGAESEPVTIEIKNDWVVAPVIMCEQTGNDEVTLMWTAAEGIVTYHITAFTGDNESILRFVELDYTKYGEYDVQVDQSAMEFVFTCEEDIDAEAGEKVKFEIYGIRYTDAGEEQKTATTTQTITIKPLNDDNDAIE